MLPINEQPIKTRTDTSVCRIGVGQSQPKTDLWVPIFQCLFKCVFKVVHGGTNEVRLTFFNAALSQAIVSALIIEHPHGVAVGVFTCNGAWLGEPLFCVF